MDPWTVLTGIAALAVVFVLIPVVRDAYLRFRATRRLRCPETGDDAQVSVDARHAAFTAAFRQPRLRVKSCSRWPEQRGCQQSCLGSFEAAGSEPIGPEAVKR